MRSCYNGTYQSNIDNRNQKYPGHTDMTTTIENDREHVGYQCGAQPNECRSVTKSNWEADKFHDDEAKNYGAGKLATTVAFTLCK